jgi:molybdopterin molybdotransferase
MPEFLKLLAPDDARKLLLDTLIAPLADSETIPTLAALGRTAAEDVFAPHALPEFPRSSMDGYAVRGRDTYGASDSLPAYLVLAGEVPMGGRPPFSLRTGECALIHTGGMLPEGADAVVMLEYTQGTRAPDSSAKPDAPPGEIEILRAVADGENVIHVGEDVKEGQLVIPKGSLLRPAEIGGLAALGSMELRVVTLPRVGLIATGDEVVPAEQRPSPGQVRDVNSYSLAALIERSGGEPVRYGIVRDSFEELRVIAGQALEACDALIITAGSSASTRDMTAEVINTLGAPGVLVHGINTRPGKPTILAVCGGKAVIGLPGNPVSALVNGYLFVAPVVEKLLGALPRPRPSLQARLTVNLPSQAGREDWWPVRVVRTSRAGLGGGAESALEYLAEPIFGKSNLIFTLAAADGLLKIPADATGLDAGEVVVVWLIT